MYCAIRGLSSIQDGASKKLITQYDEMEQFFHGKEPSHPSQVRLLSEASSPYHLLFDEVHSVATKKNASVSNTTRFVLKDILSLDSSRKYFSNESINYLDLEKKNRTGSLLITGRHLYDMAKRGMKNYRKALSFCAKRYDLKTKTVKDSGHTIEDVIQYVRRRMYHHLKKKKLSKLENDSEAEDIVDDDDTSATREEQEPSNPCGTTSEKNDESSEVNIDTPCVTTSEKNDESSDVNTDTNNAVNASPTNAIVTDKYVTDEDDTEIPEDFCFPSYYIFVTCGPFASPEEELDVLKIDDSGTKSKDGSMKMHRKKEKLIKDVARECDATSERGLTSSERIDLENLEMQKQMMRDRQNETSIVALSIEEAAITKQLAMAEARADRRCPEFDPNNIYWKRVDVLVEKQDDIIKRLSAFNNVKDNETESAVKKRAAVDVLDNVKDNETESVVKKRAAVEVLDLDSSNESVSTLNDCVHPPPKVSKGK